MIGSEYLLPLAQRWSAYAALSADDRDALMSLPFTRKSFAKESYLVREGQSTRDCMLLLCGFAYRQKVLTDGSRQIISIHVPTEFVDLQNGLLEVADHSVQSLGPSEVAIVPRDAIMKLCDARPAIRTAMWTETLLDASIFREWASGDPSASAAPALPAAAGWRGRRGSKARGYCPAGASRCSSFYWPGSVVTPGWSA